MKLKIRSLKKGGKIYSTFVVTGTIDLAGEKTRPTRISGKLMEVSDTDVEDAYDGIVIRFPGHGKRADENTLRWALLFRNVSKPSGQNTHTLVVKSSFMNGGSPIKDKVAQLVWTGYLPTFAFAPEEHFVRPSVAFPANMEPDVPRFFTAYGLRTDPVTEATFAINGGVAAPADFIFDDSDLQFWAADFSVSAAGNDGILKVSSEQETETITGVKIV